MASKEFFVFVEKDEDEYYVGEVPQLKACYSQGKTLDELMINIKEVNELCLEAEDVSSLPEFVGIHKIEI